MINQIMKKAGEKALKADLAKIDPSRLPEGITEIKDIPYIKDSVLHLYNLGIHEVNINCVFENVWKEGDDYLFLNQLMELADAIINKGLFGWYIHLVC